MDDQIVKISAAMLRQKFHSCTLEYIQKVCKGRCCQGAKGIAVFVHPWETEYFEGLGAKIENSFILPDTRGLCPFKAISGLCSIHETKPRGCRFSPFTLNKNNTLIVRNRYRLLKCYKDPEGKEPAYLAHFWGLKQIFGKNTAEKIKNHLDGGGGDLFVSMPKASLAIMKGNNIARKAAV